MTGGFYAIRAGRAHGPFASAAEAQRAAAALALGPQTEASGSAAVRHVSTWPGDPPVRVVEVRCGARSKL